MGGFVADLWDYRACFLITGILLAAGGLLVTLMVREARTNRKGNDDDSFLEGLRLVLRSPGVLVRVRGTLAGVSGDAHGLAPCCRSSSRR